MKYRLTHETINHFGRILYRIEALKDFSNVKKGDKGGFIEKETNLSQYGNCWVYGDAIVYGDAEVYNNAEVYDNARVYGNARVFIGAKVYDNAKVYEDAIVCGDVRVYGNAIVFGNARVYGDAIVYGDARIYGYAIVKEKGDYIVFKNNWSSGRYFTWTKSNNMWKVGCFYGTGEELIKKAYEDSEESGKKYEAYVRFVEQLEKL